MKNKKAFTLVELIAIIVIIGVIAVLVLPQVKSNSYNKKQKQYENIVSTIENAAKLYYINNTSTTKIDISTLIEKDYLSSGIINPITKEKIVGCVVVSQSVDNINEYHYSSDTTFCSNP